MEAHFHANILKVMRTLESHGYREIKMDLEEPSVTNRGGLVGSCHHYSGHCEDCKAYLIVLTDQPGKQLAPWLPHQESPENQVGLCPYPPQRRLA